jgi:O-antigen/teichoic acid export membrane protein
LGFVKEVLHRGKWVTASSIFNYLFHNSDDMIVGKILGISNLGLYQMAYKISIFPITEISDVVSKVVFPVYARIDNDRARLKRAFFKTLTLISVLSISLGVFLFIFAREVIFLVLGESWIDILPFLKILIIFGIIRGISGSTSALFFALNKQEYVSVVTFVSFMVLIVTIFPLTLTFGLIGVSISVLISSVAALPFMAYYTFKVLYE